VFATTTICGAGVEVGTGVEVASGRGVAVGSTGVSVGAKVAVAAALVALGTGGDAVEVQATTNSARRSANGQRIRSSSLIRMTGFSEGRGYRIG
jgi:hypothetical protein